MSNLEQRDSFEDKAQKVKMPYIAERWPGGMLTNFITIRKAVKKMAAIAIDGEPASKLIMYRDQAESICDLCKKDNGDYMRVTEAFIHWTKPEPSAAVKDKIQAKVLGSPTTN